MPTRTVNSVARGPSRKRDRQSRGEADDVTQEIVDVRRATSTLQQDRRKRVRVSSPGPSAHARARRRISNDEPSDENEDEDDDEREGEGAKQSQNSPSKTQYELKRDQGFTHLRDEAADDQRATQKMMHRTNLIGENHAAENGILETLECYNFMCHEHLKVPLGPLLNFIVGENGSGKSAILTGITLCLGGKASSTNRGGSLKSFVKEGTDRSVLSVTLKNQGDSAYKHDVFGDSIVIERHFSKTGSSSGFKVKSATGGLISTKRQEVDEIVEYYALQVDNPLNILSQDNARQFLNASTKSQKYKFFIEGIQLQQLDTDYGLLQESIERIQAKLPDLEENSKIAKAKYEEAKRMYELFKGNREMRGTVKLLEHKIYWIQVRDQERDLARREEAIVQKDSNIDQARQAVEEKTQQLQLFDDRISQKREELEAVKVTQQEHRDQVEEAQSKFNALKDKVSELQGYERDSYLELKKANQDIKSLVQSIEKERQRLQEATGDASTRKHEERKEIDAELMDLRQRLENCKDSRPELELKAAKAREAVSEANRAAQAKQKDVANSTSKIKDLEGGSSNKYAGFDPGIPALLRAIDNDDRFEQKPVGPLGAHIQLLEPKWSRILERVMNGHLDAFIVMSKPDERLLRGLMDRCNVRNTTIVVARSTRPLDITGKEPDEGHDTILRALKIDNHLVRDQLIINYKIEQTMLHPKRQEAAKIMNENGYGPKNVSSCITINEGKGNGHSLRLTNSKSKGMQTAPMPPYNGKIRMNTNASSLLAVEKEILARAQQELRHAIDEKRRLEKELQQAELSLHGQKRSEADLKSKIRKAETLKQNIEDALDEFEGADDRLQGLEEQLTTSQKDKDHYGRLYGDQNVKKGEKNKEMEVAHAELKTRKAKADEIGNKAQEIATKIETLDRKRDAVATEKNSAVFFLNECEEDKVNAIASRDRQVDRVQKLVEKVQGLCVDAHGKPMPRPELLDSETLDNVEKRHKALAQRLVQFEKQHGMNADEAKANCAKTKKERARTTLLLESNSALLHRMEVTLALRLDRWRQFQRLISAAARVSFQYLLTERGFRGNLRIDHENKTLDLSVEPDKAEKRNRGRNTKTLSGGEKSFSSICLLLAIWEAMGSPLRCLDEFDVFMDNVNRAISTKMLIETARRSVNRQYIFITPNPINNIEKDVKIHRMTDPRQRTLPLTAG